MPHRITDHGGQFVTIGCTLAALLAAIGCGGKKPLPPNPLPGAIAQYRPECPIDTIAVRLHGDTGTVEKFTTLAVSGNATLIPEFNDCQRFPNTAITAYGPLVAIFASESLNATIGEIGKRAAAHQPDRALSVAIVLSYDGPYQALGIRQGFNCLYLAADTTRIGTAYQAWMVPVAADSACSKAMVPAQLAVMPDAMRLDVRPRNMGQQYQTADYPQVARWDWDRSGNRQYIGIGCRDAWCEIGRDFQPSQNYDNGSPSAHDRRTMQIKGWYDEEFLAVNDPAPGNSGLVPSGMVGTIVPAPGLDKLIEDQQYTSWQPVAEVWINAPVGPYAKKFNFATTKAPGKTAYNTIAMCTGSRTSCNIPAGEALSCDVSGGAWFARVQAAGTSKVTYLCVTHRTHNDAELLKRIAGVVRWRWKTSDQGAWIACPNGCCEVVGEQ